jgi:spore coat polysaccharide biosynthesis predicted glycosyltransferase SpsG
MIPHINVVLGKGYTHLDSLESYILSLPVSDRRCINLVKYANRISSYMEKADIAISSSGRTIFELASIGTPTIVLAHHERELEHNFARLENGLLLLGLGSNVELGALVGAVQMLMHSLSLRKEISQQLYKHDLTKGAERVCGIIMRGVSGEKFTGDYRDYL